MPTLPTPADRAAEFNRLVVEQAIVARNAKHKIPQTEDAARIDARATRLLELAELINPTTEPGRYVNDRIAAWLRMNPLPLTVGALAAAAEAATADQGVYVTIGELGNYGYQYRVMRNDLTTDGRPCTIQVPDSVAEHFRQQGRRALQSELRGLLNVARA